MQTITQLLCLFTSGVPTGGSGGSMNRGPRAPGGPSQATKKLNKKIIGILLKNN